MDKKERTYTIFMSLLILLIAAAIVFGPQLKQLFSLYSWESSFYNTLSEVRAGEFSRLNEDGSYTDIYLAPEADNVGGYLRYVTEDAKYLPEASRDEIEEPVLYRFIAYENAYYDAQDETLIYLWQYSPYITVEITEHYMILTEGRPQDPDYSVSYHTAPVVEIYDWASGSFTSMPPPLERCDYLYTLYAEIAPDYRFVSVL